MKRIIAFLGLMLFMASPVTSTTPHRYVVIPREYFVPIQSYVEQPKVAVLPKPTETPTEESTVAPTVKPIIGSWVYDSEVSWYGPGFYGKRTACGQALTTAIMGVAHRSLPCGTLVEFKWNGKVATVPIIDRGPYVSGRIWDLSGGLCVYLDHCFTGPIEYRILK